MKKLIKNMKRFVKSNLGFILLAAFFIAGIFASFIGMGIVVLVLTICSFLGFINGNTPETMRDWLQHIVMFFISIYFIFIGILHMLNINLS